MLHVLISSKVSFVTDQTRCHPWTTILTLFISRCCRQSGEERRNQARSPTLTWLGGVTVCLVYNLGDFTDFGKNKYWPNLFVVYGRLFLCSHVTGWWVTGWHGPWPLIGHWSPYWPLIGWSVMGWHWRPRHARGHTEAHRRHHHQPRAPRGDGGCGIQCRVMGIQG